MDLIDKETK